MGAWGRGTFDNDAASEWLDDLPSDAGLFYLQEAFSLPDGYLEVDEASNALAAAEVLVALGGRARSGLPAVAKQWAAAHSDLNPRVLKEAAASAILRVLGKDSELDQLWSDSEEYDAWRADVEMLLGTVDSL